MKREEIEAKFPGITKEQLDWIMAENGKDINAEKAVSAAQKSELEAANKTIKDLQAAAKQFDGVDVDGLKQQLTDAQAKYNADVAQLRLDSAVDLALAKAHARSGKAVRALLDMDKVQYKDGTLSGLDEQLAALKTSAAWAFDDGQSGSTGVKVSTGAEHGGAPGTAGPATLDDELKAALHL